MLRSTKVPQPHHASPQRARALTVARTEPQRRTTVYAWIEAAPNGMSVVFDRQAGRSLTDAVRRMFRIDRRDAGRLSPTSPALLPARAGR